MGASEMLTYKEDWISRSLNSCQDHRPVIFPSIFYCRYSVVKTQSTKDFKTQSSTAFISITHISLQLSKFYS